MSQDEPAGLLLARPAGFTGTLRTLEGRDAIPALVRERAALTGASAWSRRSLGYGSMAAT